MNSNIHKNIQSIFEESTVIDHVVGHKTGGSATLELEQTLPEKHSKNTYSAPVFEIADGNKWVDHDKQAPRFAVAGDPASMLDGSNTPTTLSLQILR